MGETNIILYIYVIERESSWVHINFNNRLGYHMIVNRFTKIINEIETHERKNLNNQLITIH